MTRKFNNHTLQSNPRQREEESKDTNNYKTAGRQKVNNLLFHPHQDDCKTRNDTKKRRKKMVQRQSPHDGSNNKH